MAHVSRRGRRAQAQRLHTLSLLLLGLSLLSFSLSAWFYVAVEQHLDVSTLPPALAPGAPLRPALVPLRGRVETQASPVMTPSAPRTQVALNPATPTPTEQGPRARPFVHFEPAPITSASGTQDPNKHVVSAPPTSPSEPAPPPAAGGAAHPPMEGGFAQDAHRFQLGPGLAPPLATPVDPRLTWMVIAIFSLSNLVLIAVLGGGTSSRTA